MVVRLVLMAKLLHQLLGQIIGLFHGREDLLAVQHVPGGCDDGGLGVLLPQQGHGLGQLLLAELLGTAEDDGAGVLHLVVIELTEVLHIGFALGGVGHGDGAAQHHLRLALGHIYHGLCHIRQLPHAGGLDQDPVRMELLLHLVEGGAEVAYQGAADAAGVHLRDLDAGILEKSAVNADLAELILDQDDLLALDRFLQELFDQSRLSCPQKAGNHINFCHMLRLASKMVPLPLLTFLILHFFQKKTRGIRGFYEISRNASK